MSRLCNWFGHRPVDGYAGRPPYFVLKSTIQDGTGTVHARLWVECQRCGLNYQIGNVHLPKENG